MREESQKANRCESACGHVTCLISSSPSIKAAHTVEPNTDQVCGEVGYICYWTDQQSGKKKSSFQVILHSHTNKIGCYESLFKSACLHAAGWSQFPFDTVL